MKFTNMSSDTEKKQRFLDSGHQWITDEEGDIEIFAFSSAGHNGPECEVCGYSACWHCNPNPPKCDGGVVSDQINIGNAEK